MYDEAHIHTYIGCIRCAVTAADVVRLRRDIAYLRSGCSARRALSRKKLTNHNQFFSSYSTVIGQFLTA